MMVRFAVFIWLLLVPFSANAQNAATLVADSLQLSATNQLIASGNVVVSFEGTQLSASRLIYDQATDRLLIEGPIFIRTVDGDILTATSADLDPRLQNGILLSARLVLDEQLQMAALQINRSEGRYTQLYKVVASSCSVCQGRAPLWDIRAERVVHDQAAQQLYFENAQFRIRGIPVIWLPRMRLPDPTLTRATGLLIPDLRSTDLLGVGIKLPFFVRLGESRDITLTPYISSRTTTLEARYRQAFLAGDLEVLISGSRDTILPDTWRGYAYAKAEFALAQDFRLNILAQSTSDDGYLSHYGYGDGDRLQSTFALTRYRADEAVSAEVHLFQGLLSGVTNDSVPPIATQLRYQRTLYPDQLGGQLRLTGGIDAHARLDDSSGTDRDVARFGMSADWSRGAVLPLGVLANVTAGLRLDSYRTWQDTNYDDFALRGTPEMGMTLRWPLMRATSPGVTHVIEPVVALSWSQTYGPDTANEDSTRPVLDEGNLIALSHFPGQDRQDSGAKFAYGVTWTRMDDRRWQARLTFGQILHQTAESEATQSSGLDGTVSDWLLAGQIDFPSGLQLDGRILLDPALEPSKTALRVSWKSSDLDLAAGYVYLNSDPGEERPSEVSEWTLDAEYDITEVWRLALNGRYDMVSSSLAQAGIAVQWRNECVTLELSASRSFISSTTVDPSTDFGLNVGLNGFSAGRSGAAPRRTCTN